MGIDASFVVADVYDAVTALGGRRFDVVYTGTGALLWLPDIARWAQVVADAGLRIDFLNEHDFDVFQRFESLELRDSQYRYPAGHPGVPMMFSLRATRPV